MGPPVSRQSIRSVCSTPGFMVQRTQTWPLGIESAPYLAALVASSCSTIATGCVASAVNRAAGPSRVVLPTVAYGANSARIRSARLTPCHRRRLNNAWVPAIDPMRFCNDWTKSSVEPLPSRVRSMSVLTRVSIFFTRWSSSSISSRSLFARRTMRLVSNESATVTIAAAIVCHNNRLHTSAKIWFLGMLAVTSRGRPLNRRALTIRPAPRSCIQLVQLEASELASVRKNGCVATDSSS